MHKKKYIKGNLRKGDFQRAVVTDTAPYEMPLIVSNDGFYKNISEGTSAPVSRQELAGSGLTAIARKDYTIPYRYNIKKDGSSFRQLSLIHPSLQCRVIDFYQKYHSLICFYASRGKFSIRHPAKVGSTFSFSTNISDKNQFKNDVVDLTQIEFFIRNPASFFAYEGYDRIYKYFSSDEFFRNEKKFPKLALMDVSKCFSSIYTHTLPWAIKGCDFTKLNLHAASFGDDFDNLMQKMNYNETNGICIGPELSRIFAEIILQAVDVDIDAKAVSHDLHLGTDYHCRRYVDDYIVFAKNEETLDKIKGIVELGLKAYNLHLNEAKYLKYDRPFITPKSYIIHSAKAVIGDFLEERLTSKFNSFVVPKKIFRSRSFEKSFLNALKSICAEQKVGYDAVSDYVISSVAKRIIQLTSDYDLIKKADRPEEDLYQAAFQILFDTLLFLYSVNPTVSSSYQVGRALIVLIRFVREKMPDSYPSIAGHVHSLISQFIRQCVNIETATFQSKVPVEILNILLASRELGSPYLLEEEWLLNNVFDIEKMEYFSIVSCLYYVRGDSRYNQLRTDVEAAILKQLDSCKGVLKRAHDAHLCLDIITCPYVSLPTKLQLYRDLRMVLKLPIKNDVTLATYLTDIAAQPWFVQWQTVDVLNMLKKKELSAVY
ncbi:antiviral reverse transcriptase Drt3b [Asticcacaulis sp. EMRT-3]|uniref:antiviral reverse transcriptase Drt3b n=1 Tax=Asticcacaulis sp. EMRT-3 TaxID=3040349 RepID=UPI0024AE8CF4|nr:antiviral reverse transcriptase Drt3b [Asticcacaulis sp. EMRT-3]MDI7774964.1 RNA-directed DNA polymerase [Asticcacaulis sp. EMRT-3]